MRATERTPGSGNVLKLLKSRSVALGRAGCGAFLMGQFALFTYLRPFLETVTQVSVTTLSLIFLVSGVGLHRHHDHHHVAEAGLVAPPA